MAKHSLSFLICMKIIYVEWYNPKRKSSKYMQYAEYSSISVDIVEEKQ